MKTRSLIAATLCSFLCANARATEPIPDRDRVCSDAYADKLAVELDLATKSDEPRAGREKLFEQYFEDLGILNDAVDEEKTQHLVPRVCEYTQIFFRYQNAIQQIQQEVVLYKESYTQKPQDIIATRGHTDCLEIYFDDVRIIERSLQDMTSAQPYDPNDLAYSIDLFLKQEQFLYIDAFQTVRSAAEKITRLSVEQLNRDEVDSLLFAEDFLRDTTNHNRFLRRELAFEMESWKYTAARAMTKWSEDLATTTKIRPQDIVRKRAMLKELQESLK